MGLPKGRTNNPAGKPKGATSKITLTIRDRIGNFIDDNFERFIQDIDQLESKDRVKAFMELLQYSTPKLQAESLRVSIENGEIQPPAWYQAAMQERIEPFIFTDSIDYDKLSDSALQEIIAAKRDSTGN